MISCFQICRLSIMQFNMPIDTHMLQCNNYSILWVYFTTSEIGLGAVASATTTSWPSETPRSKDVDEEELVFILSENSKWFLPPYNTHTQWQHYWNWNTYMLYKWYINWLWNMEVRYRTYNRKWVHSRTPQALVSTFTAYTALYNC